MLIKHEPGYKIKFYSPQPAVDYGGNVYIAIERNDGFTGSVVVFKVDTAGQVTEYPRIPAVVGKGDQSGMFISGDRLYIVYTTHEGDTAANLFYEQVPNVTVVPYPGGQYPMGADGAYVPDNGGGGNGLSEEDKVWMQARLDAAIDNIRGQFGGNIRQGIEDKAKDAIRELNMWSPSMQERGINQFIKDRVYEVLTENWPDLFPRPTAPQAPEAPAEKVEGV